jgi:hypothetical protein
MAAKSSPGRGRREGAYIDRPTDASFIFLSRRRFWFLLPDYLPRGGFSGHSRQIFLVKVTSYQLQFVIVVGSARPVNAAPSL